MDKLTRALVQAAVDVFRPPAPVLEIGSRQVQGPGLADMRPLFPAADYVGCDMEPGPGVDAISRIESLGFQDGWAGTVLCLNVLEHAWGFREGIDEIVRVTRAGGLVLLVTVFSFRVHAYPCDYWRFTPHALARLLAPFETVLYGWQGHRKQPRLVFALGQKGRMERPAERAETWRYRSLVHWSEHLPWRARIGAAIGGPLFGRRYFRTVRHWWDLTIRVADSGRKA